MEISSVEVLNNAARDPRISLWRVSILSIIMFLIAGFWGIAVAQPNTHNSNSNNPEVNACKSETCPAYCRQLDVPKTSVGQCVAQCKQSCVPPPPPTVTVTVTPKYYVTAVAYAPPGCTLGPAPQCLTSNSHTSSFVDYSSSTSNGTKVTTKDSFQLGLTISYNAKFLGVLGGGGSYSFQNTTSDSSAATVTKTTIADWNVQGNGDGVDHGQDQFFLLLHPTLTISKSGTQIQWGFNSPGSPYQVYAYELQKPWTARASTTQVFQELGMTNTDYQNILNEDPFGGTVVSSGGGGLHSVVSSAGITEASTFTTGGPPPPPGAGLDPGRFWFTGLSFPYEPAASLPDCNNGGVCNCDSYIGQMVNDKVSDTGTSDEGQTTVDLEGGVSLPLSQSLKIDSKLVWTSSSTTDNITEGKQAATATVSCPSNNYAGPFGIQVWWDSRYGSFVLIPYDPGTVYMIHRGKVTSASNQPIHGQLVTMLYNGKIHRTYTAHDGSYGFPSWSGAPKFLGSAQIKSGAVTQTVNLESVTPIVMKMK